jgi:hypothetical protein
MFYGSGLSDSAKKDLIEGLLELEQAETWEKTLGALLAAQVSCPRPVHPMCMLNGISTH